MRRKLLLLAALAIAVAGLPSVAASASPTRPDQKIVLVVGRYPCGAGMRERRPRIDFQIAWFRAISGAESSRWKSQREACRAIGALAWLVGAPGSP